MIAPTLVGNTRMIGELFERRKVSPLQASAFFVSGHTGLTIRPERLRRIRAECAPNRGDASLENCRLEVKQAEHLIRRFNIPFMDVTIMAAEDTATTPAQQKSLPR